MRNLLSTTGVWYAAAPTINKQLRIWIVGFLVSISLLAGLQLAHKLLWMEYFLFDFQAFVLRDFHPRTVARDVVIVGIDEASTRAFEEPLILWHKHFAEFLNATVNARAAAVGLDVVLPDRSMNRFIPGQDEMLMGALLKARRSIPTEVAITFDEVGAPKSIYPGFMAAVGNQGMGMAIFPRDHDNVIRRFDERLATDGSELPTFTGNLARLLGATPGSGYIDFSIGGKFIYLPLHEVIKQAATGNLLELQNAMRGKIVLLGAVIAGVDQVAQPVSLTSWADDKLSPGVVMHAQALRTILNGGLLQPVSLPKTILLIIAASLFWFVPLRAIPAGIILPGLMAGFLGAALFFQIKGSIFPLAAVFCSLTLSIAGRQSVETYLRLSERSRLKLAFSGYVSPAIMQEIVSGSLTPSSNGTLAEVCVLFADMRDYTSISQHMTPEQVIAFLNLYYEGVVKTIHEHGGSVISFMGDGIMAVFGAPKVLDNSCVAGINASRGMLKYVDYLNSMRQDSELRTIKIGIGLNFGRAVMGHVGTRDRHEYSAIGDVTNTASRIEGLTKTAGYPIVCSRAVYEAAGSPADFHSLGFREIRGRGAIELFGVDAS